MVRDGDPNLLVGPETADDAGVYRIGEGLALVETVDIITPLVDDPYTFGRIAAANALSDVFAMGGRPVTAMNLVFFPACALPGSVLSAILAGGHDALREAGACLVGGHTVEDDELKYGLAVTGLISPSRVVRNATARAGDRLVLTKPLGTGIVSTAIKADMAPAALTAEAIRWMTMLNAEAAGLMLECGASACTDVTGFGLVGHACEVARGAGVTLRLHLEQVPVLDGVMGLVADGLVPAGCYRNRDHYAPFVGAPRSDDDRLLPLFDPQTSGGLLLSLSPSSAGRFLAAAGDRGLFALEVGEVLPAGECAVDVV
ncbi:selenide, water dikinase SelD [Geobacter sulfurreducens subsp. ethanolicus]|nr:selenide, water dikinase SelD [Geobacter sulfurreducens subsp. ethanolicus]BET57023.1 selenide, water dikinase SelD [Geobacter sp. 60473]